MNPGFKVASAAKCHKANGEMSLDARLRPVKHVSHFQVVLGDAEGVFDSPSSAVVRQQLRCRALGDAGDDAGQSVPLCGFGDLVAIHRHFGITFHHQEAYIAARAC